MKYRSRADIIATILRATTNGATKTHIMYGAYLSYAQIKDYLGFMTVKGLIFQEESTGLYKLTDDGVRVLRTYEGISDMISVKETPVP